MSGNAQKAILDFNKADQNFHCQKFFQFTVLQRVQLLEDYLHLNKVQKISNVTLKKSQFYIAIHSGHEVFFLHQTVLIM